MIFSCAKPVPNPSAGAGAAHVAVHAGRAVRWSTLMRLTKFTDYALRVLILAASRGDENVTIEEAARLYGISASHLKKVVRRLSREGFLKGTRGRAGGFRLAMPAAEINLGRVIRITEPDLALVECFLPGNACGISRACRLPPILNRALDAMLSVFEAHTLADISLSADSFDPLPLACGAAPMPVRGQGCRPHSPDSAAGHTTEGLPELASAPRGIHSGTGA